MLSLKPAHYLLAALAQLVRALVCGTRGPQFETERRYHFQNYLFYSVAALNAQEDYPEFARWRASKDAREGISAFTEKRKPNWQGR